MTVARWIRPLLTPPWRIRLAFSQRTLAAIEAAIARVERNHAGHIRFAVETAVPSAYRWRRASSRARALEAFSSLRVWDTERNNGVLIYVLWAERRLEIVADRGFGQRVRPSEWEAVCRLIEGYFREGRFRDGAIAGIDAVGALLSRHYPSAEASAGRTATERPGQPALL
jgi:uncharacterized membrane protein